MELTICLFQWLKTFELKGKCDVPKDLCDGVAITHALVKIAPEYFSPWLLNKIENDCGDSWYLRVSNLRKIYISIVDYYGEVLDRHIPEKIQPDLEVIARNYDLIHLGNLLQLILGLAINCANKEKHIEVMTTLSLEVKHGLKVAIDELENFEESSNAKETSIQGVTENVPVSIQTCTVEEFNRLQEELSEANILKEKALEKCSELETLFNKLKEEKQNLKSENDKLSEKLSSSLKNVFSNDKNIRFDSIENENFFQRQNNQINALQIELTKMEEQREDYRINLEIKEKEYHKLLLQVEQLQTKLNEFKHDRDELDRLKYLNEEIIKYKNINDIQKKKLEEFQELKKQIKLLEDRNAQLIKQTCELEEDKKSIAVFKSQLDYIKKQRDDLRAKANEENFRADKAEDELKRLYKKYTDIVQDKEKIQLELEHVKYELSNLNKEDNLQVSGIIEELTPTNSGPSQAFSSGLSYFENKNNFGDNADLNEKIIRLEYENSKIKKELEKSNDERIQLLESQLEDEKNRVSKLESQNHANNQRIIELEGLIKDRKFAEDSLSGKANNDETVSLQTKLNELQLENNNLKTLVEKKTEELAEKEERFKKHVHKAKETFDLLETHINNSKISSSLPDTSKVHSDDPCYWRNLSNQKDIEIEKLKSDFDKANAFRDMEERLMTISFHNMSFNLQRKSAEDRIYSNNFTPNSTFLSRQRQASSRKFIIPPRTNET